MIPHKDWPKMTPPKNDNFWTLWMGGAPKCPKSVSHFCTSDIMWYFDNLATLEKATFGNRWRVQQPYGFSLITK